MPFLWEGSKWARKPGRVRKVVCGQDGDVWAVAPDGDLFRWTGTAWQSIPLPANKVTADLAVGQKE